MNIKIQATNNGLSFLMNRTQLMSGNGLKSTQDRLERQAKRDSQVAFLEKQKENLKDMKTESLEDISRKLELLRGYNDQITAAKAEYNNSQKMHLLDEAIERGEKIAEEAEKNAPKTPEERREEIIREATGEDKDTGVRSGVLEELTEATEEITEEMSEAKNLNKEDDGMNIGGISGNSVGTQPFRINMNSGSDPTSRNIQNQIAAAQKQLQDLGDKKEMPPEEKMKKRQEIQQQISDLQNQLRQHQIEQRRENGSGSGTSMDDLLGGSRHIRGKIKNDTGMSSAGMQAIISAGSSMEQVKAKGALKTEMEGRAGVLDAEIKLDSARGDDVSKKKEELARVEAKAQDISASQMSIISDIDKKLDEAAESDRKVSEADKSEYADKKDDLTTASKNVDIQGNSVDIRL